MSHKILKLDFDVTQSEVLVNEGAQFLSGTYEDGPVLFALVDLKKPLVPKPVKVLPTNAPVDDLEGWNYKLTFYSACGYAWHLFEYNP